MKIETIGFTVLLSGFVLCSHAAMRSCDEATEFLWRIGLPNQMNEFSYYGAEGYYNFDRSTEQVEALQNLRFLVKRGKVELLAYQVAQFGVAQESPDVQDAACDVYVALVEQGCFIERAKQVVRENDVKNSLQGLHKIKNVLEDLGYKSKLSER